MKAGMRRDSHNVRMRLVPFRADSLARKNKTRLQRVAVGGDTLDDGDELGTIGAVDLVAGARGVRTRDEDGIAERGGVFVL